MFKILFFVALMISLPAFSQPHRKHAGPGGPGGGQGLKPACAPIREACEKAGFKVRGGQQGTLRDCLNKWSAGESVPGLKTKPTDEDGKLCADHLQNMKNRRAERAGRRGNRDGTGNNAPGGKEPGAMNPKTAPAPPPSPEASKPSAPAVLPAVPANPPPKNP